MTRLGKHQLARLIVLGSPTMMQVVGDKISDSLVRRGFAKQEKDGSFVRVTPAGLRALADAMERGEVEDALKRMKRDAAKRKARTKGLL